MCWTCWSTVCLGHLSDLLSSLVWSFDSFGGYLIDCKWIEWRIWYEAEKIRKSKGPSQQVKAHVRYEWSRTLKLESWSIYHKLNALALCSHLRPMIWLWNYETYSTNLYNMMCSNFSVNYFAWVSMLCITIVCWQQDLWLFNAIATLAYRCGETCRFNWTFATRLRCECTR